MPRLFTGLEIPPDIGQTLSNLRGGLPGARWIDPENYHVTLRFIGDIDGAAASEIASTLERINRKPFEVALQGLSSFGGKKPRAVVASVVPSRPLMELQAELERLMQRFGFDPEGRKFIPHVTLARLRDASNQDVADYLSVRGYFPTRSFMASRFVLFSSRASVGGGPYVVEDAYALSAQRAFGTFVVLHFARHSGGQRAMNAPSRASFRRHYQALVAAGTIEADPAQAQAVEAFSALETRLAGYRPGRGGLLQRLFADKDAAPLRGLYIHGEVGRGKTMLMDLFFNESPVAHKRRAHFHEFMADVHERIHGFRQKIARQEIGDTDPVRLTAQSIFEEAWLLCFDEFHVTDIADAMILGRLFSRLFELGTVVVATSNVAPGDLYKGGLNRALFLPFIGQLADRMEVLRLDARTDFRLEKLAGIKMWLVPADASADAALDKAWTKLTGGAADHPRDVMIKGHVLHVPHSAHGVARFTFADLCEKPLGASDYLRLAHDYHTLIIDRIPAMQYPQRNYAKRFITLIDTLYDNAVKLMASAETDPLSLYTATQGVEANEFKRTSSRLIEMGSESYLALPHGRSDSSASGATTGLVET